MSDNPQPTSTPPADPGFDQAGFEKFQALEKAAGESAFADDVPEEEPEQPLANTAKGETPEPDEGETEEKQPPKVDVEQLAKSTQALKRYGMTAAMVNKLSSEEIIEAGERLLKIQEDNDKAQSDLKTLRLGASAKTSETREESKTPATPAADLGKWKERLTEKFGDDAQDVIEFVQEMVKPAVERLSALEARAIQSAVDSAIERVAGVYPAAKEAETKARLIEKAQKIAGAYEDEYSCLMDAAKLLDLDKATSKDESATKADAQAKENGRKRAGLPTTNGRSGPPASARSKADLETEAMLAFEDGDRDKGNRLMALARAAG